MNELFHYGVLGMKWGVRKDRKNGRSSASTSRSKRNTTKRKVSRAGKIALKSAAMATLLAGTVAAISPSQIATGKSSVDSYLAANGNRKASDVIDFERAKKKIDRSDWTWADYAWAEVEG